MALKYFTKKYKTDIYVIGYSLGGTIATFAALDIKRRFPQF